MPAGTDLPGRLRPLWEAALRDAAEPLATFATPEAMGLATLSVRGVGEDAQSAFLGAIRKRIDLGRALQFSALIEELEPSLTGAYRHELVVSDGVLRGKLHMPSYVRERSIGRLHKFPALRVKRVLVTPENLLASEGLALSLGVARAWGRAHGAEGVVARRLLGRLISIDSRHPWSSLRHAPRPSFNALGAIIEGRAIAGAISQGHPALRAVELFSAQPGSSTAFEAGASPLALAATTHEAFADRLFELLCLAWTTDALKAISTSFSIFPERVKASRGQPLAEAGGSWGRASIYYQTAAPLRRSRWSDRRTRQPFRALPDIVVEVQPTSRLSSLVIIDAKNRPRGSWSEVAYKLLGYRENVTERPFLAFGVFPSDSLVMRRLQKGHDHVILARIPLDRGRMILRKAVRAMLGRS